MRGAASALALAVGGLGVIQVALGITFWTGSADSLIPVHMFIGMAIVLCLWALAGLGLAARIPVVLSLAGFVWGALTVSYGMAQEAVLSGNLHWIAQVLHLTVGLIAILLAGLIAREIRGRRPAATV